MRPSQREHSQLRPISFERHFIHYPEGSVLVSYGKTRVLCNASVTPGVPRFLKGKNQGWLTAEYGMLPRATAERTVREAASGRQAGRTMEIQRLIGRALRACLDLSQLGDYTIAIDCDVLQADGGTRTASISGACVALVDALRFMQRQRWIKHDPFKHFVAGVSVGMYQGQPVLDLDYAEDMHAQTDMNVIMTDANEFIEVQGTAESKPFNQEELNQMLALAKQGIIEIIEKQKIALEA